QSDWRCTVIDHSSVRLGVCIVSGLRQPHGEEMVLRRKERLFDSLEDFKRRVALSKEELRRLAEAGALNCFADHRRAAMWRVEEGLHDDLLGSTYVRRAAFDTLPNRLTHAEEFPTRAPETAREGACPPR